jgi:GTP cyclohydrolase I
MTRAGASLHVARGGGADIDAARRAAADFLSALGIPIDREDLRETPARMARAYAQRRPGGRPRRLTLIRRGRPR